MVYHLITVTVSKQTEGIKMLMPHWKLELPIELVKEIPVKLYGKEGKEKHYVDVNGNKAVVFMEDINKKGTINA